MAIGNCVNFVDCKIFGLFAGVFATIMKRIIDYITICSAIPQHMLSHRRIVTPQCTRRLYKKLSDLRALCGLVEILVIGVVVATGCDRHSAVRSELDRADALMEEHPDSSLRILEAIRSDSLSGEELARHSLLISMAIDKNYIDTTVFDILQPAIDFYKKHGTPDERLQTLYYLGRIYQNRGESEKANKVFLNALELKGEVTDSMVLARTNVAIAQTFKYWLVLTEYVKYYSYAADIYRHLGREELYYDCLLSMLNGYNLLDNKERADSILMLCSEGRKDGHIESSLFRSYHLAYITHFGLSAQLDSIINLCRDNRVGSTIDLMMIANGCLEAGDTSRAAEILKDVRTSGIEYDTLKYQSILIDLYRVTGDYKNAFEECLRFFNTNDSLNLIKFRNAQIESQHHHEFQLAVISDSQFKSGIITVIIAVMFTLLFAVMILVYSLRIHKAKNHRLAMNNQMTDLEQNLIRQIAKTTEAENIRLHLERKQQELESDNMRLRMAELSSEIEHLKEINSENNHDVAQEVKEVIQNRISMLNAFLASRLSSSARHEDLYEKWTRELISDKNKFMQENRLAFQVCYPKFIDNLKNQDLDDGEIEYVCLYAIGLRGTEISSYLNSTSHLHISSAVRKKLGLGKHDTNLGNYIKKLLDESR